MIERRATVSGLVISVLAGTLAAQGLEPPAGGFKAGPVKVNGLLQGWFVSDQKPGARDGFSVRRAEIKLSGQVHPQVDWFVMIDPAKPLNIKTSAQGGSLTAAQADPKTMILKDAAIVVSGWGRLEGASLKVGQFKPPFGWEGLDSSAQLETVERAAQSAVLGWSDYRDIGALAAYRRGIWAVSLGAFNGEGPNSLDANRDKDAACKVEAEPLAGLHVGASAYHGHGKGARFLNERWGLEASWTRPPWSLKGEYAAGHGATSEAGSPGRRTAYGQAGWFFHPRLQAVARFDWWEPDTAAGGDIANETTAGLNWLIDGHRIKAQANYVVRQAERAKGYGILRIALQAGF
ncbi:MAG: hypothetical protein HY748_14965 [Elusimicrobia bacterium]|nr:hypothetical protein [Elusimicrobiota bacterium]